MECKISEPLGEVISDLLPYIMVLYRDASSTHPENVLLPSDLYLLSQASPSQFRVITQCIFEFNVSKSSMTEINIASSYH